MGMSSAAAENRSLLSIDIRPRHPAQWLPTSEEREPALIAQLSAAARRNAGSEQAELRVHQLCQARTQIVQQRVCGRCELTVDVVPVVE